MILSTVELRATMHTQGDAITHDSSKRSKLRAESDVPHAVQRTNMQLILQYVGPGDWFYIGAVSTSWQQVYKRICQKHAQQQKLWVLKRGKRCYVDPFTATSTYYSKAFASLSRLQLACALGLELDGADCLPQQACRCADKQTLLWARTHGLPWCEELTRSLADCGRLDMLQWARSGKQCPWYEKGIVTAALQRADLPMLNWLRSQIELAAFRNAARLCCESSIGLAFVGSIAVLAWLQVRLLTVI
jgi:hypothetical protein